VKHGEGNTNPPELPLLKFFHHSHFLATTLDFTSFFITTAFLWAAHFFYSWAVFGLDLV